MGFPSSRTPSLLRRGPFRPVPTPERSRETHLDSRALDAIDDLIDAVCVEEWASFRRATRACTLWGEGLEDPAHVGLPLLEGGVRPSTSTIVQPVAPFRYAVADASARSPGSHVGIFAPLIPPATARVRQRTLERSPEVGCTDAQADMTAASGAVSVRVDDGDAQVRIGCREDDARAVDQQRPALRRNERGA